MSAPGHVVERAGALTTAAPSDRMARRVVVISSVVAALIHIWVVPEHWAEWPPAAIFFIVVAGLQLALARRTHTTPGPLVVTLGLIGTVALVMFYVATRTVDLPFLPVHGSDHLPVAWGIGNGVPVFPGDRIEDVGLPDLVCLAAELVTVAALCALGTPVLRRLATSGLLVLGVVMITMRLVGLLG
jgi:hypothetical protein